MKMCVFLLFVATCVVCFQRGSIGLPSVLKVPLTLKAIDGDCIVSLQTLTCVSIPSVVPKNITKVVILNHQGDIPESAFTDNTWVNIRILHFTGSNFSDVPEYLFASLVNIEELLLNFPDVRKFSRRAFVGLKNVKRLVMIEMSEVNFLTLENVFTEPNSLPKLSSLTFNPGVHSNMPAWFGFPNFTKAFLKKPIKLLNVSNTVVIGKLSTGIELLLKLDVLNISGATIIPDPRQSLNQIHSTSIIKLQKRFTIAYQSIRKGLLSLVYSNYTPQPLLHTLDISGVLTPYGSTATRGGTAISLFSTFQPRGYHHRIPNVFTKDRDLKKINPLVFKIINLYANNVQRVPTDIHDSYDFRKDDVLLRRVYVRNNHVEKINCSLLLNQNNNLELVDLSNNRLQYISPMVFSTMTNLQYLYLAQNKLYLMENHADIEVLFQSLKKLIELDLEGNNLTYIPWKMFHENTKIRFLNLALNKLKTVTFDLSRLVLLEKFDMSNNAIHFIDGTSFASLVAYVQDRQTKTVPLTVDFTGNPFECKCNSLRFIKWLSKFTKVDNNTVIVASLCSYEGSLIEINDSAAYKCWYLCHRTVIVSLSVSLSVFVVSIIVVVVLLCRRLRTRKALHKKEHYFRSQFLSGKLPQKYIAFLAHSSADEDIVNYEISCRFQKDLQTRLDTNNNTLCTGKDFQPGCSIMKEAFRLVDLSCVFVAVVSQSFCRSVYCRAEVQEACNQNKPIILLFIEEVNEEDMSPYMKEIFRRNARAKLVKQDDGCLEFVPNLDVTCGSIFHLAVNCYSL